MQIKESMSCAERRRMYAAWINTGDGWYLSDLLFESMDSLRRHYKGMPEYARRYAPRQADGWKHAEIIVVPVEVSIPDETKEVQ